MFVCAYVTLYSCLLCLHAFVYAAAIVLDYPEMFGNLVLPDVQVANSGEFEVQVRLPGFGDNNQPLNANSPKSVNVDVQGQCDVPVVYSCMYLSLATMCDKTS